MSRRIIDLSVTLTDEVPADPPGMCPKIEYMEHSGGARDDEQMIGIPVAHQMDGAAAAVGRLPLTTHNGTHPDAPWHCRPTMNHGERAITIDEVPLAWCMGPGVKLDFRHLPDGHVVSAAKMAAEFARLEHDLQPGKIVLVDTGAGVHGQPG
ncbi:cyclase family protein [Salipiger mangrovisoli]|uniref:cyclase family protein n=1 Tax=Salipiger mangrovisoli TaxID=2865933 RepID=UPI0030B840CE